MGRNRKKTGVGAVEAVTYDIFGNVIGEREETPTQSGQAAIPAPTPTPVRQKAPEPESLSVIQQRQAAEQAFNQMNTEQQTVALAQTNNEVLKDFLAGRIINTSVRATIIRIFQEIYTNSESWWEDIVNYVGPEYDPALSDLSITDYNESIFSVSRSERAALNRYEKLQNVALQWLNANPEYKPTEE